MGYSLEDIADAALTTQQARINRAISLENTRWDSFKVVGERVNRKIKNILSSSVKESKKKIVSSRSA
jgi:hypothetical protein